MPMTLPIEGEIYAINGQPARTVINVAFGADGEVTITYCHLLPGERCGRLLDVQLDSWTAWCGEQKAITEVVPSQPLKRSRRATDNGQSNGDRRHHRRRWND